ncbi:MAG TPA: ABC transporter permease [Clostridia bacterium]|nr:ABC transporter permease [Clostridia bacterium]
MIKKRIQKEFLSPGRLAWEKLKRNRLAMFGMAVLIVLVIASLLAPILATHDRDAVDMFAVEQAPGNGHLLGTDDIGRDVFSRLLFGGQISLGVGFAAVLLQVLIGVTLGAVSGYFGGFVDALIMRIVDMVMCFPFYVIAISMAAIFGGSAMNIVIIIGVLSWTGVARIVRAQVLSLRTREFIEAAKALGLRPWEIILKHMLPNCLSPIIVNATLGMAVAILTEAGLSFLGMGVRPPQPSWGNMLSAAQSMIALRYQWWRWLPPGLLVFLTVLSINFLGDGLRDALDPRTKTR